MACDFLPAGQSTANGLPQDSWIADDALVRALERAVRETLEVMFLVDTLDEGSSPPAEDRRCADSRTDPPETTRIVVPFRGGRTGNLQLEIDGTLACYCHEGLHPWEDDSHDESFTASRPPDGAAHACSIQDSMRELGNIVCGLLLSKRWPELLFTVEEPFAAAPESCPASPGAITCRVGTSEGAIVARLTLERDLQQPKRDLEMQPAK